MKSVIFTLGMTLTATLLFGQKTAWVVDEKACEVNIFFNDKAAPADCFSREENVLLYEFISKMHGVVIDYSRKEGETAAVKTEK